MKRILLALVVVAFALPANGWSASWTSSTGDVTMTVRDVPLAARTLQAVSPPARFNMLGVHWQGSGRVDYRTRPAAGGWGAWRTADADTGPDAGSGEGPPSRWHDGN